jgi:hypothetical protein
MLHEPQTLDYSKPESYDRRRQWFLVIGITSVCFAAIALGVFVRLFLQATTIGRGLIGIVFAWTMLLALGGYLLLKKDDRGVFLHRLWAVGQLLASLLLCIDGIIAVLHSPMPGAFAFGAVPGFVIALYPIVVLLGLRDMDSQQPPEVDPFELEEQKNEIATKLEAMTKRG